MERVRQQLWVNPRAWHEMEIQHGSSPETCRGNSRSDRMIIPYQTEGGRVGTHLTSERSVSEEKNMSDPPLPLFSPSTGQFKKQNKILSYLCFFSRLWKQILKVQHPKKFLVIEKTQAIDRVYFSLLIWMSESLRCQNRRGFVSPERWQTTDRSHGLVLGQMFQQRDL